MGRKVFISVLGAGNYNECIYIKDNFTSEPVCYIQEATLKMLHAEQGWDSNDAAYILLTDGAEEKHWKQLSSRFAQMKFSFAVESVKIPIGNNEAEIWDIFTRSFEQIKEEDTLYIDITHGFRYLPMLVVALINYSKFMKRATVASITYGNYEARNFDTNEAQIIDLTSLSTLLDWNYAAGEFINNGNISPMAELSNSVIAPIMKNAETRSKEVRELGAFLKSLSIFIDELRTCRGKDIIKAKNLKSAYSNFDCMAQGLIAPLTPIFERIKESLYKFSIDGSTMNTLAAAHWCHEQGMYQQALTFLREGVITIICERYGLGYITESERKPVENIIHHIKEKTEKEKIKEKITATINLAQYPQKLIKLINDEFITHEFALKYDSLTTYRNDFNHSGMRVEAKTPQNIKDNVNSLITYFENFFTVNESTESDTKILLNFSNHPSENWNKFQIAAAAKYGSIIDVPFPTIDENAATEKICNLADEYMKKIQSYGSSKNVTIHIMGEQTFLYSMLHRLQAAGYCCIASTTKRNSEELPDGSRKETFIFAKFREYEVI